MARTWFRLIALLALAASVLAVGVWAWHAGQAERAREAARELNIKLPARRVTDPETGRVSIRLDAESQGRAGIVVEPVVRRQRQKHLHLTGFSVLVPHRVTELRSPWAGVLEAPPDGSLPTVGRSVRAGQVVGRLVVQWSPADRIQLENQWHAIQGTVEETEAELTVARSAVERLRSLGAGTVAARQQIEAEGNVARLAARLDAAQSQAKAFRAVLTNDRPAGHLAIVAPAAGQVTVLHARPGEIVAAGDRVATLYDPQELWVEALALPGEVAVDALPPDAEIRFAGFAAETIAAQFARVAQEADRAQPALPLIFRAANPEGRIPVGLPAEVQVPRGQPFDALAVPRSAVVQHEGGHVVYVQLSAEDFARHAVEVLDEDATQMFLRPTLPDDARVVRQGAQVLLSEEYKESIQLVEESGSAGQAEAEEK